jgi:hypothetical protein
MISNYDILVISKYIHVFQYRYPFQISLVLSRYVILLEILLRQASPQGSDQTVKKRPRGPQLEPYGSPPFPRPSNQPTLNRQTRLPTLSRSPWGNPCVGVPSKGSFEHSETPAIRAGRPFPPSSAVAPQPVASSYQRFRYPWCYPVMLSCYIRPYPWYLSSCPYMVCGFVWAFSAVRGFFLAPTPCQYP